MVDYWFLETLQLVANLLAFTYLYSVFYERITRLNVPWRYVITGVLFGLFALVNMLQPLQIVPGYRLDARDAMVIAAGVFGGPLAAIIAAVIAGVYRVGLGGVGLVSGLVSLVVSVLLGGGYHRYAKQRGRRWYEVFALGVFSALFNMITAPLLVPNYGYSLMLQVALPLLLSDSLTLLVIGLLMDREEAGRRTHRALAEAQTKFQAVFEQAFQFMCLLDKDGNLIDVNRAIVEAGGGNKASYTGKSIWGETLWGHTPASSAQVRDAVGRAAQGEPGRTQIVLQIDDQARTLDIVIKPITNPQGHVDWLLAEGRDITAQLEAEQHRSNFERQKQLTDAMETFIADASHDFRSPLTALTTTTYLLDANVQRLTEVFALVEAGVTTDASDPQRVAVREGSALLERIGGRVPVLEQKTEQLLHLVDDMLELASPVKMGPLDLNDLVQSITGGYGSTIEQNTLHLAVVVCDEPLVIQADEDRLKRAIQNLLDNAVQYTRAGGLITVRTSRDTDHALLHVEDTGIGIEEAEQTRVFERFHRTSTARQTRESGTGLGLAIVKQTAEAHGGDITLTSAPGAGTTFVLRLPL